MSPASSPLPSALSGPASARGRQMAADAALRVLLRGVRLRVLMDRLAIGLPLLLGAAALLWRGLGADVALPTTCGLAVGLLLWIILGIRRVDRAWLLSRLDAQRRDLEDSSALLVADATCLSPVARLQQARVQQRLLQAPSSDGHAAGVQPAGLHPAWSRRDIALSSIVGLLACVLAWAWPVAPDTAGTLVSRPTGELAAPGPPRLVAQHLEATPPAYTGAAVQAGDALDLKTAQGSQLAWRLRFEPQAGRVELLMHDGQRIAMQREGGDWVARHVLAQSLLYRVVADHGREAAAATDAPGAPTTPVGRLHRIEAVVDQPPRVQVLVPERSLVMLAPGQRSWSLAFEANDDYGVATQARLHLVRTEGSGENIRFHETTRVLSGRGSATSRRFEVDIALSAFPLQFGEDLIARLEVRDNRSPDPQPGRSASVILRRPPEPVTDVAGLEGLARQVLPAYFRSQRQIIIDAEALLKQRAALSETSFVERSDGIGVDQRLLRLRYGQFLGEESEGGARPPPTSDSDDESDAEDAHAHADDASAHDDHDHDAAVPPPGNFGQEGNLLETFGHTHDLPEAATLLDPATRDILRKALQEMWQSELFLRQGKPDTALPYAYRALAFIKQVQQADRIYLPRLGQELPPMDETRRMTGKREGIEARALTALSPVTANSVIGQAWFALSPLAGDVPDLDALQRWIDAQRARLDDPLGLIAAMDAVRIEPACASCRADLRKLLWRQMTRPAAGIAPRAAGDAAGRHYLQRLAAPGETR